MKNYVIKRNGEYEPLQLFKIEDAIKQCFKSVNASYDERIYLQVLQALEQKTTWAVEEVQDIIEKHLYNSGYFEVMRSFMLYRHTRKLQREHVSGLNEDPYLVQACSKVH